MSEDTDHKVWSWTKRVMQGAKATRSLYRHHILRYETDEPYVFGIGDSRTGTTSLSHALEYLGVPTTHWPRTNERPKSGWIDWIDTAPYQGFVDHPISDHHFFKELDQAFPDAKYVLTTRDEASWKASVQSYFQGTAIPVDDNAVNEWYNAMREHEAAAKAYFDDDKLAVIPVAAEDKWERLCDLLNKETPDRAYPHANQRSELRQNLLRM